jgi:cell shape-determining protein MreC
MFKVSRGKKQYYKQSNNHYLYISIMNKISVFICIFAVALTVSACEGCARKAAKKVTNVGLSVLEGVTEAVSERGDTIAEKLTDAAGNVAQGA